MGLDNDELLARFAAEHFERHSISLPRRHQTLVVLRHLAAGLGDRTLTEMTASDLMAWQGAELNRGLKPTTVRKEQNMIRSFIGWAYAVQLLPFELTMQLKSVSDVRGASAISRPRPYKRREIEIFRELLAAKLPLTPTHGKGSRLIAGYRRGTSPFRAGIRWHARRLQCEAQVSLALEEGLRRTEIYHLSLAEMHYDNDSVVVTTAKSKPGERREREVPFTSHSRQCIQEWLDFRRLMVPGHDRPWLTLRPIDPIGPQSFEYFRNTFRPWEGNWCWHRFRHTFATERLRAGMPLEQLQVMLGHATLQQTLAYAEIVNADVRVEAERSQAQFERNLGLLAA